LPLVRDCNVLIVIKFVKGKPQLRKQLGSYGSSAIPLLSYSQREGRHMFHNISSKGPGGKRERKRLTDLI
jgi:hypothetical protein